MKHFDKCQVERRYERKGYTLDPLTGNRPVEQTSTVIQLCGAPLFGTNTATGVCSSCQNGFEAPGNQITKKGWKSIRRANRDRQWAALLEGEPQVPLPMHGTEETRFSLAKMARHVFNLVRAVRAGHLFHHPLEKH